MDRLCSVTVYIRKGVIIINFRRLTKKVIAILLIALITFSTSCTDKVKSENKNGPLPISSSHIKKFVLVDRRSIYKEVKKKSDIKKIINLVNSLKITGSTKDTYAGEGYGMSITYSNGEKIGLAFLGGTMAYGKNRKYILTYFIDRSILNDLEDYYNKI